MHIPAVQRVRVFKLPSGGSAPNAQLLGAAATEVKFEEPAYSMDPGATHYYSLGNDTTHYSFAEDEDQSYVFVTKGAAAYCRCTALLSSVVSAEPESTNQVHKAHQNSEGQQPAGAWLFCGMCAWCTAVPCWT